MDVKEKLKAINKRYFGKIIERDPKRINRILGKIATIWHCSTDLRFGQLFTVIRSGKIDDPFHIEDDKFEKMCDDYVNGFKVAEEYIVIKKRDLERITEYSENINAYEIMEIINEILE